MNASDPGRRAGASVRRGGAVVMWAVLVTIYFAPSIVASLRGTPGRHAVIAVNLLVGWVAAMVMALA